MNAEPIDVLFVEDSEDDVALELRALEREGLQVSWRHVGAEAALREALAAAVPDVILSDFSMAGFDGLLALKMSRCLAPTVPFIFVSGTIGEERAIEAIRLGATDYVLKDHMRRLGTALRRALAEAAERKAYEARIKYLANYDALSGLPNRDLLADRTAQAITHAGRVGRACALVVLDIDGFKLINDSYGRAGGDTLLKQLGERLRAKVREGDTAARLGAGAFAVLATDLVRADDVLGATRKIHESIKPPFYIDGHEVHLSLSIGASVHPRDGKDFETLLTNADAATHRVKADGGKGFQFYQAAMTREATERVELESALRSALERRELELHYQPQIDITSGRICGVEALMRWRHVERGWISPARFIPIAEESGLIQPLGAWALAEGCRRLAAWDHEGHADLQMAINVSASQFRSDGFVDAVKRALHNHGLDPHRLELELTESVLVDNRGEALSVLGRLKALGVKIAIDDFGTGYSSLNYLSRIPLSCLKIDRSFVIRVTEGGRDATIAQAVISLAHSLGLRVLAEGVETVEQLDFFRSHGCDEAQGYFFAQPCGADSVTSLLARCKA